MRRIVLLVGVAVLALLGLSEWRIYAQGKPEGGPTYVGDAACLCHTDPVHKSWATTKHAKAFELLKLAGQEKNEKCLACHTTGYGKGGYGTAGVTVNLEGVQCEECHGPASQHVGTGDKTKITRTPSVLVCARCHQELSIHAK
jgi:hypothetical protein